MTHNEYTQQYAELTYQADKARQICATVVDADMPEERRQVYLEYHGNLAYRLQTEADALRTSYYGTLKHNIYG
jgi:hypothetical protein